MLRYVASLIHLVMKDERFNFGLTSLKKREYILLTIYYLRKRS